MTRNDTLSPAKRRAIAALLTSRNVKSAAGVAGVSVVTMFRWLRDPDFRAALHAAQDEALAQIVRRLVDTSARAIVVIRASMARDQPPAIRLRAAALALAALPGYLEAHDLAERVALLEEHDHTSHQD